MEAQNNTIKYHFEMVEKMFDFGRKKIVYHENSHLLFSYFFGMCCLYVDYTINSNVELKDKNLEIEFESLAHANINLPQTLNEYLAFLHLGGSTEEFIARTGISSDALVNGTNAYLAVLFAGYEAERYFFSGNEYADVRDYIQQNGQDFTIKNIQEDETRANIIMSNLGFSDDIRNQIRNNAISKINVVLGEDKMKVLFDELYNISLSKNRLVQNDIEAFLTYHRFDEWSNEIMEKLSSQND